MARPPLDDAVGKEREVERFWSKVERGRKRECWPWIGGSTRDGYGQFHPFRLRGKVQAHRYAYELLVGPVPSDLTLDHLCRNRACCNPAHLEPVTHRVNILRGTGASARNLRKTHCAQGHEYTEENTYIRYDGRRECRVCQRKWHRDKMRKRRTRLD